MAGFGPARLGGFIVGGFAVAFAVLALDWRLRPDADPIARWPLQWAVWALPGLAVFMAEVLTTDAPLSTVLGSSIRMFIGSVTLGFFASSWLCLGLEHEWYLELQRTKRASPQRYLSIASRIIGFSMRASIGIGLVILTLIFKQLGRPVSQGLLIEVCVVLFVMVASLTLIGIGYRRNFALLYQNELDALQAVREGRLDAAVPLVSADEFRRIAEGTNEMIEGLREREKMRTTLGKHFSPQTARRILQAGGGLGGEAMECTILFTDLRDYTGLAESLPPELVVSILNEYFTMVVDAVRRNGGEVDKFIGDAAMAVFGLYGTPGSCDAAVRAASEMRNGMAELRRRLRARGLPDVDSGIGIHHGRVVAGNMGSPDRVEHTVIGDAVNVAARLEGITKEIGRPVAISGAVYEKLAPLERSMLTFHGDVALKGKTDRVPIFGLTDVTRASPVLRK